jgi:hypothetical protein
MVLESPRSQSASKAYRGDLSARTSPLALAAYVLLSDSSHSRPLNRRRSIQLDRFQPGVVLWELIIYQTPSDY